MDQRKIPIFAVIMSILTLVVRGCHGAKPPRKMGTRWITGFVPFGISHRQSLMTPSGHQTDGRNYLPVIPARTTNRRLANFMASPKRGSVVDSYQTVSVNCSKCQTRLFRYKKKNGTKSNLIKCYVERIVEEEDRDITSNQDDKFHCPKCQTNYARSAMIRGRPALKLVGGKVRMTKK
eukprot:scaffold24007_cov49-Attheya_sp.AAC.1